MQKMIFVMQKAAKRNDYRFDAADFGPFAWQLSNDLDYLVASGFVNEGKFQAGGREKYEYKITSEGISLVEGLLSESATKKEISDSLKELERIKSENNHLDLKTLLRNVYSKYPEYATKSKYQF